MSAVAVEADRTLPGSQFPETRPQARWQQEIDTFDPVRAGSAVTRLQAGDQITGSM